MTPRLVHRDPPGLADVQGLEPRELLGVLVDDVRELQEKLHAVLGRLRLPLLPRLLRRIDRPLDVLRRAPRHLGDHLAGGRVQDLHGLARGRLDELPADELLLLGNGNAHTTSDPGISAGAYPWSGLKRQATTHRVEPRRRADSRRRNRGRRLRLRADRARAARSSRAVPSPTTTRRVRTTSSRPRRRPLLGTCGRRIEHDVDSRADPRDPRRRGPELGRPALQRARSSTRASRPG